MITNEFNIGIASIDLIMPQYSQIPYLHLMFQLILSLIFLWLRIHHRYHLVCSIQKAIASAHREQEYQRLLQAIVNMVAQTIGLYSSMI